MFAKRDLVLAQEYFGFLLLNLFDLFLTGWIFKHEGQEGNAVAQYVLQNYGLAGFAVFKFAMVAFIIVICEAISAFISLQRARLVILGACALYVMVVLWECVLIFQYIDGSAEQQNPYGLVLAAAMAALVAAR